MSEERQKSIVAAILAVRSGIVSPDEAVAALKDPGKASTLVDWRDGEAPKVTLSDEQGEFVELPILDVLEDPAKQQRALRDIGIDEKAQATLFNFGSNGDEDDTGMRVLADTLKQVAGAKALGDSGMEPAPEISDSEQPTKRPEEKTGVLRLTTGKFLPNFGMENERYEVRREHARGGMGRIMLARDKAIGRDIALKELLPGVKSGSTSIPASVPAGISESGGIEERFLREAKITGQLEHPNIVPVYEIGKNSDDSIYYTMRFVRGQTLADRLREIRKDESLGKSEKLAARIKLLDTFIDVCQAIAYAHHKGVIHRDLKPENIMLGEFGETQVLDWGLARLKGHEDKALKELQKGTIALSQSLYQSDSQALTLDGSIVGTPAYMAPEQARGELDNVDEQSDVYALGAVLYQILTGVPPYEAPMAALIIQQVLNGPPIPVRQREKDLPPELDALVQQAMGREKKDRIKSALELASEVKAFRDGRTLGSYQYSFGEMVVRYVRQHRTAVSIGVLGFLLIVAGTIFFVQQLQDERNEAMAAQEAAESDRLIAQSALDNAERERAERERLEREKRQAAQAEMNARVDEARRLRDTITGMKMTPAIDDLDGRLSHYGGLLLDSGGKLIELSVEDQIGNSVLLSNLLGYISARQNFIDLITVSDGVELPDDLTLIDLAEQRNELNTLRLDTARLATINGDFPLALLLLSDGEIPLADVSKAKRDIETTRSALLMLQSRRIGEAIADVEQGLDRVERADDAPTLADYAQRLSTYRERQTVDLFATELDRLMGRGPSVWTRSQFDVAVLACRVLGSVDQPSAAIPVLVDVLSRANRPELAHEAALALCATGSMDAFAPLMGELEKRGLDFWSHIERDFANVPMPMRIRTPEVAKDFVERSIALHARGEFFDAELAATRALNQDETNLAALLHRARANIGLENEEAAVDDLERGIEDAEDPYEFLLQRGDLLDTVAEFDAKVEIYSRAIKLDRNDERAWRRRGQVYGSRLRTQEAQEDFERAIDLEPYRIETYFEYAEVLQSRGRDLIREAEAQLTIAIEQWPGDWRGWSRRCMLRREGGLGNVMEDGLVATKLNPLDARAWDAMSQIYFATSDFVEGIDAATRAVEANPEQWLAFYYRGLHWHKWSERTDGQHYNAIHDPEIEPVAGFAEGRLNKLTKAEASFRAAHEVEPEDLRTSLLHVDTLLQLERWDDAWVACDDAVSRNTFCHMRWGGEVAAEMRYRHDALKYRELMDREPTDNRERLGKVQILAAAAGAGRYEVHPGKQRRWLREAVALLIAVYDDGANTAKSDIPLACYAHDRLVDALTAGGGRSYYSDVLKLVERREELGWFVDRSTKYSKVLALAGVAREFESAKWSVLGADVTERDAEIELLDALPETERKKLAQRNSALALAAFESLLNEGFRASDLPQRWSNGPLGDLQTSDRWAELDALLDSPAPPDTEQPSPMYETGLFLSGVTEGGPAWMAGMRRQDRIVSVNGVAVSSTQDFLGTWGPAEIGSDVTIEVTRFKFVNGQPTPVKDLEGKPVVDEYGLVQWETETFEVTVVRDFLGVNLGQGLIPARFKR